MAVAGLAGDDELMVRAGLIVPPLQGRVPPDAALMYPDTTFLVEGLGVPSMSEAGYAEAEARLNACARALADRGAKAILLFGTSFSFFRGPAFNAALEARMTAASGLPAQTLTSAMTFALQRLGVRRLAVATAYGAAVNTMFADYFTTEGFAIDAIDGLDLTSLAAAETAGEGQVANLSRQVVRAAPQAEALVISCAGLTTAGVAPQLETELGLPVVSSSMVGAWAAQGLAGGLARVGGFGQVFDMEDGR